MGRQSASGITLVKALDHTAWEVVTIVAGTLIVVQGFETTRYLGDDFDAEVRVSASRWSQIISTAVYVVFVALALPVVHTLNGKYDYNSLIALVGVAAAVLAVPLIVAAALSQFSAAVADTLAATGNMQETTHGHLKAKWGCILVGGGAIALTWSASTRDPRARLAGVCLLPHAAVPGGDQREPVDLAAGRDVTRRRGARVYHGLRGSRGLI